MSLRDISVYLARALCEVERPERVKILTGMLGREATDADLDDVALAACKPGIGEDGIDKVIKMMVAWREAATYRYDDAFVTATQIARFVREAG